MAVIAASGESCRRCQVVNLPGAIGCANCNLFLRDESSTVERATRTRRLWGDYFLETILFSFTLGIGWLIWFIFTAPKAQTPAKLLMGTYAIDLDTGRAASTGQMWVREIVVKWLLFYWLLGTFTSGIAFLVNMLWPLWDRERQALHDKVVNQIVVYAQTGLPETMKYQARPGYQQPQPAIAQAAGPAASAPAPQAAPPSPAPAYVPEAPIDQTIVASAAPAATQDVAAQLRELRRLVDEKIISEAEYEAKRAELARKL